MAAEFFCVSCKTPFVNRHPLDETGRCMMCRLGFITYDAVYSYGSYEGTLRKLIHVFKFQKVHTLAHPLSRLLADALPREQRFDVVVPMPLHWRRRWQRGFNQSELLAQEIARRWNIPVVKAIRRVKASPPQAGLTNAKRRANVAGAFSNASRWSGVIRFFIRRAGDRMSNTMRRRLRGLVKPHRLDGKRVLLMDDVLTTGATAAACARALKRAGAAHVTLLTVARTDRRFAVHDFLEATSATSGAARIAATAAGAGGTTFE
ncbi:MAG: phosphoribosyltransferase family protein [Bryobacteraceae bacterium]